MVAVFEVVFEVVLPCLSFVDGEDWTCRRQAVV